MTTRIAFRPSRHSRAFTFLNPPSYRPSTQCPTTGLDAKCKGVLVSNKFDEEAAFELLSEEFGYKKTAAGPAPAKEAKKRAAEAEPAGAYGGGLIDKTQKQEEEEEEEEGDEEEVRSERAASERRPWPVSLPSVRRARRISPRCGPGG